MLDLSSKGILHRDLSARNVLVDKSLNIKLVDFSRAVKMTTAAGYQDNFLDDGQEKKFQLRWIAPEVMEVVKFHFKLTKHAMLFFVNVII